MSGISTFLSQFDWGSLGEWVLRAVAVLVCIMVHEVSHGFVAMSLGDPTAKQSHRLSLNPIHHIDPIGLLMMVVAGFGWAKPVPVDMRYFKNPKSGMALTALAGPASNFVLAFFALWVAGLLLKLDTTSFLISVIQFLLLVAIMSIGLCLFNLIPFPPLDGFKIVLSFLPDSLYYKALRYERYGMIVLIMVFFVGFGGQYLTDAIRVVFRFLCMLSGFPYPDLS